MSPLETVLTALRDCGLNPRKSGRSYSARCPAHADRKPSLSIKPAENGTVLAHCHAGCATRDVVKALGLKMSDLFPEGAQEPRRRSSPESEHLGRLRVAGSERDFQGLARRYAEAMSPEKREKLADELGVHPDALEQTGFGVDGDRWTWPEHDGDGRVVGIVRRWPDGTKKAIAGCNRGLVLPCHRLPTPQENEPLLVSEGASDCAALLSMGLAAIGCPSTDAGAEHLIAILSEFGGNVIVLGDNDDAGRRHAEGIAASICESIPGSVEWATTPGGHKDPREWLNHRFPDGVARVSDTALTDAGADFMSALEPRRPEPAEPRPGRARAKLICFADVKPQPLEWLWRMRFPLGSISLIVGDPGGGKPTFTSDLAARVTTGEPWPDLPGERRSPGGVIVLNAEDLLDSIVVPRFRAAGGELSRAMFMAGVETAGGARYFTLDQIDALEDALTQMLDCRLVIIDPVSAYLGSVNSDKDAAVRGLLAPLADLASRYRVAVILVQHANKSQGTKALYRPGGSIGFVATARAAWVLGADPGNERRRLLVPLKCNLAPSATGLAFEIESVEVAGSDSVGRARYLNEVVSVSADELLGSDTGRTSSQSAVGRAKSFLVERLADGPVLSTELEEAAKAAGISVASFRRAKTDLGVEAVKEGFDGGWACALPEGAHEGAQGAHRGDMSIFGENAHLRGEQPSSDRSPA